MKLYLGNFKKLQIFKNTRISIVQNVDGEKHKYTYEMWEYLTNIVISENLWTAEKGYLQYKTIFEIDNHHHC